MLTPTRWLLTALLVLAVAGCGGDDAADGAPDGQPGQSPSGDTSGEQPPTGTDGDNAPDDAADGPAADTGADADVQATVEVRDGQVVGGVERVEADVGDTVTLTVSSDVADHVHVHGYDLQKPVAPGEPATVTFQADIPGVFEVELEDRGLKVAELRIGG